MNTSTYFLGMAASAGLIMAIGAQNAFILRQGVRREHVGAVVTLCAASDAALIALGTAGIGAASTVFPLAIPLMTVAGILFLSVYGLQAARRAWRPTGDGLDGHGGPALPLRSALLQAAAFSWLNPHAWLDTTVLLGSLANAQGDGRWTFAAGAMTSSLLWFTVLAWTAGRLAPLFRRPHTWRVFDAGVAMMMLALAGGLTLQTLKG
ncbi:LysE/ArgO family amino acid transporter [Sphaerotilus sp.]|uniref:LysE/ArgO family amino acid transporter n=1 Tax=Sphaerotilus sp. TaxID=2093942 RepID=UPI0034E23EBF